MWRTRLRAFSRMVGEYGPEVHVLCSLIFCPKNATPFGFLAPLAEDQQANVIALCPSCVRPFARPCVRPFVNIFQKNLLGND